MNKNSTYKIIKHNLKNIILITLLIGLLIGCFKWMLYVYDSQYISQGLYKNAFYSMLKFFNIFFKKSLISSFCFSILFLLSYSINKNENKAWAFLIGICSGLAVLLTWGYDLNRYDLGKYWKTESSFLGFNIPSAILEPKVIGINIAVLILSTILFLILFKLLSFLFDRTLKTNKKFFQSKILAKIVISGLIILLFLNVFNYLYRENYKKGPNIVLITVDSLRADHMGCYGYNRDTSPNIDKLVKDGFLFSRVIAQAPWTLPSYVSMRTSKYVFEHGVDLGDKRVDFKIRTLAEILREYGYYNAGFISGPFLKSIFGFGRGFDIYNEEASSTTGYWSHRDITSPKLTELILDFLRKNYNKKFFLFLHYWDVHYDYIPPSPYDKIFDPNYHGSMDGKGFRFNNNFKVGMDPADYNHIVSLYDGEIRWTDMHIGILLKELDKLGLSKKTIIIFTSDHGDEFLEHGLKGHEHSLYDELIRVPLIIKIPRFAGKASKKIDTTVESIDIAPTILDLVGIPIIENFSGSSLTPLILNKGKYKNYKAISETSKGTYGKYKSIEINKFKLILRSDGKNELYDLAKDPTEKKNIYKEKPALSKYYEKELKKYLDDKKRVQFSPKTLVFDKGIKEQLKALGYIN